MVELACEAATTSDHFIDDGRRRSVRIGRPVPRNPKGLWPRKEVKGAEYSCTEMFHVRRRASPPYPLFPHTRRPEGA